MWNIKTKLKKNTFFYILLKIMKSSMKYLFFSIILWFLWLLFFIFLILENYPMSFFSSLLIIFFTRFLINSKKKIIKINFFEFKDIFENKKIVILNKEYNFLFSKDWNFISYQNNNNILLRGKIIIKKKNILNFELCFPSIKLDEIIEFAKSLNIKNIKFKSKDKNGFLKIFLFYFSLIISHLLISLYLYPSNVNIIYLNITSVIVNN